ncbi:MAG: nicotinate-nicotinamide nucleotide adenylyltransferase [Candidatus Saccharibacteria bacterium]|nr:nicotinate-nicotinamide nucleotide adenylyltransferase [Candidatus Saccharibacteria bacterium]
MSKPKRIGIFSGSFDPVHKGHIAFALSAIEQAKLDAVYFAPETKPRRKPNVSHISHRVSMLDLATRSQPRLHVLDLTARFFTPKSTISKLQQKFPGTELVLLMGSDMVEHLHTWNHVDYMLRHVELAIGVRSNSDEEVVTNLLTVLPVQPLATTIIHSELSGASSSTIRSALRAGDSSPAVTASVQNYAKKNWLYHDVTNL